MMSNNKNSCSSWHQTWIQGRIYLRRNSRDEWWKWKVVRSRQWFVWACIWVGAYSKWVLEYSDHDGEHEWRSDQELSSSSSSSFIIIIIILLIIHHHHHHQHDHYRHHSWSSASWSWLIIIVIINMVNAPYHMWHAYHKTNANHGIPQWEWVRFPYSIYICIDACMMKWDDSMYTRTTWMWVSEWIKWTIGGLNSWPRVFETHALPTELTVQLMMDDSR